MYLDDVAVGDGCCEPGLVEEHAPALFIEGEVGGEDLDGDGAVENGVLGLPDHTHPALADLLDEPVVGEHPASLGAHETLPFAPETAWLAVVGMLDGVADARNTRLRGSPRAVQARGGSAACACP